MRTRILVTGADGFTGKYVCSALRDRNVEVFGLTEDLSTTAQSIDIRDKDAVSEIIKLLRPTSVVHLAAISNVNYWAEQDFYKVNVLGTENILSCISESGCVIDTIVIASSANIYGTQSDPIKEDHVPNPQNAYALSKLQMEEMIREKFKDLPITIVRPFNYTGVGQSTAFLVPKIVAAFKEKQREITLGNLNVARDFSDVRFIAQAYVTLVLQQVKHELLNLCSGNLISLNEIVSLCEELTDHHINVRSDDKLKRKNEVTSLSGDATHMQEVLGYKSSYSLRDTLKWMLI